MICQYKEQEEERLEGEGEGGGSEEHASATCTSTTSTTTSDTTTSDTTERNKQQHQHHYNHHNPYQNNYVHLPPSSPHYYLRMGYPETPFIMKELSPMFDIDTTSIHTTANSTSNSDTTSDRDSRDSSDGTIKKKNSIFLKDPTKHHGIHCRFGMGGEIAEPHFDTGRNMAAVVYGRYR